MNKKDAEKRIAGKNASEASMSSSVKRNDTERILIENFVSLQKVMVNLSVKFDGLTQQISKLLDLFEISAKALAEKDFEIEKSNRENMKILEKIENVLEQNKTIARGLSLMHDRLSEPPGNPIRPPQQRIPAQPPLFKPFQKSQLNGKAFEEYHKPISNGQ